MNGSAIPGTARSGATHVVVVGGGVSGLATAHYLRALGQRADSPLLVTVLEESSRPGGKIWTIRSDGFIVEAGPDSFFNQKPHALQLCREIGLGEELIGSNDANYETCVWRRGRLWPLPRGFRMGIPTQIKPFLTTPLLSWRAKLRMALDLVAPARPANSDESVGAFLSRRLGREVVDRMAGPILGAIYAADPYRMSARAILPQLLDLERRYGSLTIGLRAARRHRAKSGITSLSIFSTLHSGMEEFPKRLAERLGSDLQLNVRVHSVFPKDRRWQVLANDRLWMADAVILAVPARTAARLVAPWSPEAETRLEQLPVSSSAVVALAYREEDLTQSLRDRPSGVVVALGENAELLALTWSSAKFDHRAPPGWHLLRAFIGGPLQEDLARRGPEDLLNSTLCELRRMLGIRSGPRQVWIFRWPDANPQMEVGHLDRISDIERALACHPGLFLTGSAYNGIGLADCVRAARTTAEKVWTYVCGKATAT